MSHQSELNGLKSDMSGLLAAVDHHVAEVTALLATALIPVDNSAEFAMLRVQLSEVTAKLAAALAPVTTPSPVPISPAV